MKNVSHWFFVYRARGAICELHQQLPDGGLHVDGPMWPATFQEEAAILRAAFNLAEQRHACRQDEFLVVIEVRDRTRMIQAKMMELDKQRADAKFENFMVTGQDVTRCDRTGYDETKRDCT